MANPQRLQSLDTFRGLTIAAMILVNNPGSWEFVYAPLRHAEWHGWTPTDLIFPFFLFIVGVAMSFSLIARAERGESRSRLLRRVFRRSVVLIGLGLFMAGFPDFDIGSMRYPGVLQRIGLVYFPAAVIALNTKVRGQVVVVMALLFGYWALMTLVPVPGFGTGDLSAEGNLGAHLDRLVFGIHLWQSGWDPEGLLSTLPAIATTLTGVLTGSLLRSGRSPADITASLFTLGWIGIVVGLAWHPFFPINKNIWTSSYVVFTTGAALSGLAVCYWTIDVKGSTRWAQPAVILGLNAITVFFLSGLLARLLLRTTVSLSNGESTSLYTWIYRSLFVPVAGPLNGSLGFAIATVVFWFGWMALLYRHKIFVKI